MARVDRYEDLVCWRLADELADVVDAMTSKGKVLEDFDLRRQLRKAVAKAPAQISEGFVRYTPADTANLLRIARASLAETRNQLRRGHKRGYWKDEDYQKAMVLADRALGATTNFMAERLRTAEQMARKPVRQRRFPAPKKKCVGESA
jgi:four helix bundle protein